MAGADQISPVATDTTTVCEPVLLDVAGDLALLYAKRDSRELLVRVLPAKDEDPAHFSKPRKLLDVSRLRKLGWSPRTDLKAGIAAAYRDYLAEAEEPGNPAEL